MTIATGAKPKEDLVVIITRMFDAPRELVFQAFNDPKHIVRFWGPNGFTSTVRELDPRPGGAFRIDMRAPDGATYLCEGVCREIIVPQRIVLSGDPDCGHPCGGGLPPGALVAITFTEHGSKTKLTIQTRFESQMGLDAAVEMGFNGRWTQTLDRFAAELEKR
jgi:uncharacterized protein YndB with AHSA1/START domain